MQRFDDNRGEPMTRFPAPPTNRAARALLGVSAAIVLAVAASGCATSSPAAAPTPDPFVGLADRSDQAFREGLEKYGQGQYRDAQTAFERARLLSPTTDPRIDQMLERTRAAMAPTPTPVPPTPTSLPVTPTAVPVTQSSLLPDTDLGQRYFGQVTLSVVPGRDTAPTPARQFFFQDQVALRIEGLKQHLRLPFMLRVFNSDTGLLVAEVRSDEASATATAPRNATSTIPTPSSASPDSARPAGTASASPEATPTVKLARFWDNYIWYHEGGEEPGRFRAELYANGTLTNTFDYTVGTVPVATPTLEPAPAIDPSPTLPVEPMPTLAPIVEVKTAPGVAAAPVKQAEPIPTPQPTLPPTPTPTATPATASSAVVGGMPAGLDVNLQTGRVLVADASGVIWNSDPSRPSFNRPFNLDRTPVDLAIDQTTGNAFVSARNAPAVLVVDPAGRVLKTIDMPVTPGNVQVDSELGLLYVSLPEQQALGVVDMRAGRLLRTVDGLPQLTSLALDSDRHVLYAGHLGGQVTSIDVVSSQVTGRVSATGVGLADVATARGVAYAISTVSHELAVVDPVSQSVARFVLRDEPAAIAASEDSGTVYVLATRPTDSIVRIDPTDGSEVGRVLLPQRAGRFSMTKPGQGEFQGLRSRVVLARADESLYVTLPEAGTLSVVPTDQFPVLAYEVTSPQLGDGVAAVIPGALRPAASALPDVPASTFRAAPNAEEAN